MQKTDSSPSNFSNIARHIPAALIALDNRFRIVAWNAAAERIYGWMAAEAIGKSFGDLLRTDFGDQAKDEVERQARQEETWSGKVTQARKDGVRISAFFSISAVHDEAGNPGGFIGVNHDIGEQNPPEDLLQESQQPFYKIFHSSPTAMVLSRLADGRFVEANESFSRITGYAFDEVIGLTSTEAGIAADPNAREERLAALKRDGQLPGFEIEITRKSGEIRNGLATVGIVSIKGEKFAVTTFIDVTERKQAERRLVQMKRLYATLSQVNQTIVRVKDQDDLYQSICDVAVQFGEFSLAWVGLMDEAGDVRPVASAGLDLAQWPFPNINIKKGAFKDGLIAAAIRTSQVMTSEDIVIDKRAQHLHEQLEQYDYHSSAAVPFRLRGRTIGVLSLVSADVGLFKAEEEVRLLLEMGLDISFALDTLKTEREKEETQKTMRQWADAFEHCAHGIAIGLPSTNQILTCNPAFARLQGRTVQEISFMPILSMYAPQDHERVKQSVDMADRMGSVQYEAHMIRKDGSIYPVQMDLVSVRDENGDLLYRVGTQQNITERKSAEEQLRKSEERFRTAFDNMLEGTQILGFDWRYLYLNKSAEEHNRRPNTELLGNRYMDMWPGIESTHVFAMIKRCMEERIVCQLQNEFMYPDGLVRWFDLSIQPIPEGVFILSVDITERKQAEIALTMSEENYRNLVENSENAIAVLDRDGRILYANLRGAQIWNDANLVGKTIFEIYPDEYASRYSAAIKKVIDTQTGIVDEVESLINGQTMWFRLSMSPLKDPDGTVNTLVLNAWDLTARKLAENAVLKSERQMRALVTSLDDIVFEFDERGTYLNVWVADEGLLAQSKAQLLGRRIIDVLGEENGRPFAEAVKRVLASGSSESIEYPLEVIGGMRWFVARISPILAQEGSPATASMVIRDITERKQAENQIQLQMQRIRALHDIDRAISASLDMRLSLDVLLKEVIFQLGVDAASVLVLNVFNQTLEYGAGKGFRTLAIRQSRMRLGDGFAGRVGLERKVLHVPNLVDAGEQFRRAELLKDDEFVEYFGIPLVAKGILKGVLEIFHRTHLTPDLEWVNYLETLGGQAAIAIDNAQLFEGMQQSNAELIMAYDATIAGWSHAMDLRDRETEGHTQRVTELTVKLAQRIGVRAQDLVNIRRGALLHDIGKLGVPDHILLKPGPLTDEEWIIMRQHPTYAYNMLIPIGYLQPALDIPYCHHEKWDGAGYPRGLKGEQIPLPARIFAIVDVWDALRSDRPYRAAWSTEQTLEYIQAQSGKHFDPKVVGIFLSMIEEEGRISGTE